LNEQAGLPANCALSATTPGCAADASTGLTPGTLGEGLLALGLVIAGAAILYRLWRRQGFDFERCAPVLAAVLVLAAGAHAVAAISLWWPDVMFVGTGTIALGTATVAMAAWLWLPLAKPAAGSRAAPPPDETTDRDAETRRGREDDFRDAKERLEVMVCERTRSLMRANDSLEQQTAVLSLALECSHSGLFQWDVLSDKLTFDRFAATILGLPGGEFQIMLDDFAESIIADAARAAFVRDWRGLDGGQHTVSQLPLQVRRPDGRLVWLQFRFGTRGSSLKSRAGTGLVTDVSDRVQLDNAARADRRTLVDVIESIADPVGVFDRHEQLMLWNRRYSELFGDEPAIQLEGSTLEAILRARLERGVYGFIKDREAWLDRQLAEFRNGPGMSVSRLADGCWIFFQRRRTADGTTITIGREPAQYKLADASAIAAATG